MFTNRAEHHLLLRQDNADLRLRHYGDALGVIDEARYLKLEVKRGAIDEEMEPQRRRIRVDFGLGWTALCENADYIEIDCKLLFDKIL